MLVLGGAGYIGSHMCKLLAAHGHQVAVADNLSTGHLQAVKWGTFHLGDITERVFLDSLFSKFEPDGVFHFAAKSIISEAASDPAKYYYNNVVASLNVLEHVRTQGCPIIFSSTAAIYGISQPGRIEETHPKNPINPYGSSKLCVEHMLRDYWHAHQVSSVSMRYFNAAGADSTGEIGEAHTQETHLIPRMLEAVLGRGDPVSIFGDDFETSDGTCIRDYIHVTDICQAHLLGFEYVRHRPGNYSFNLGNGEGFSVREVIAAAEHMLGRSVPYNLGPRRAGDPPMLVANADKALKELGWRPETKGLNQILASAWRWHSNRNY